MKSSKTAKKNNNKKSMPKGDWVVEKVKIKEWPGGEYSVQVTKPYVRSEENKDKFEITLFKSWWSTTNASLISHTENNKSFKNRRSFIIKDLDEYEDIRNAIENELADKLRWKIKEHISKLKIDSEDLSNIKKIIETSPKTGLKFIKEINSYIEKAGDDGADINFLQDLSEIIFEVSSKVNRRIFESLRDLIPKLAKEEKEDIESFNRLLGEYGLKDINTLTQMICQRLEAIDFFDELVVDKKTKEMSSNKLESMHYFLEDHMWILDEKYEWFLSNKQLKTLIQQEMEKGDKKHEKKRPDFALAHEDDKTLIIAEIKKPAHKLSLEDMNQLMRYRTLAEKYMGKNFNNFKSYLIGKEMDADLKSNLRNLNWLTVKTYTSITSAAKKRYREFLDILKKKKEGLKIKNNKK